MSAFRNSILVLTVFGCLSASLHASTVQVGSCVSGLVRFTTIQAAVNAVPSGSTIEVCPGTYPEQVTITQPLTLRGVSSGTSDMAVIASPAGGMIANSGSYAAGIAVVSTTAVNISNLIVDGSGNGITACQNPILAGILFNNASGTINHVVARNQTLGFTGCTFGTDGIRVRADSGSSSTVTIQNTTVHHFQSNGIYASGSGTAVIVRNNSVLGAGPSQTSGNGINVAFGATASIQNNTVLDVVWAPDSFPDFIDASYGILLQCSTGSSISGNSIGDTQTGIALLSSACESFGFPQPDNNTVSTNKILGTRLYDAISVCGSNNIIQHNTITNADQAGIHLLSNADTNACPNSTDPGSNNTVSLNTITDAGCGGIIVDGNTSGNLLSSNVFNEVASTILNPGAWCSSPTAAARPLLHLNWRADIERAVR